MSFPRHYIHILLSFFLVCALAYFNSLKAPLQFDAVIFIQENPYITDLPTFFSHFGILNLLNRSILVFTFALNRYLAQDDTLGYHLANILIHFAATLLIYLITRKIIVLSRRAGKLPHAPAHISAAYLTALIFAVHPVQVQSVTYIISRSASLSAFFYLAAFYCFLHILALKQAAPKLSATIKGFTLASLVLLLLLLGLGVKLTIVTAPAMMLIFFIVLCRQNDEPWGAFCKRQIPLLLTVSLPLLAFIIYKQFFTRRGLLGLADPGTETFGRMDYLLSQIKLLIFFYGKTFLFPLNLNVDPDLHLVESWRDPQLLAAALILGLLFLMAVRKAAPVILFSLAWFLVTLAPESSFVPLADVAAEHRLYLPMCGLILAAVLALRNPRLQLLMSIYFVLTVLLAGNTVQRNYDWLSEKALWKDAARKSPNKSRVFINYARALSLEGELEPAAENYRKAIDLNPNYFESHHNLGETYLQLGKCDLAVKEFQTALLLSPKVPETHLGLGRCYKRLGQFGAAVAAFGKAVEINPQMDSAFRELGRMHYFDLNDKEKGRFFFRQALRLNPRHPNNPAIQNLLQN